jgi:hypothetical protein
VPAGPSPPIPPGLAPLRDASPPQEAEPSHLLAYLATIPDPRGALGRRHPLVAILALAAAAVLTGARSFAAIAEWATDAPQPVRAALGARRDATDHWTVPAEATMRRALGRLDANALAAAVGAWLADRQLHYRRDSAGHAQRRRPRQQAVAIDGKTLRDACDGRPVHLLAAMDHTSRAVLAQHQVGGAPEEVSGFRPLLADLDLHGVVITADALHTHPSAAEFLVTGKQAHYLFTVKANQPTPAGPMRRPAMAPRPGRGSHPRPGARPHRGAHPQGRHRPPPRIPPRRPGLAGHPQAHRRRPARQYPASAVADRDRICDHQPRLRLGQSRLARRLLVSAYTFICRLAYGLTCKLQVRKSGAFYLQGNINGHKGCNATPKPGKGGTTTLPVTISPTVSESLPFMSPGVLHIRSTPSSSDGDCYVGVYRSNNGDPVDLIYGDKGEIVTGNFYVAGEVWAQGSVIL